MHRIKLFSLSLLSATALYFMSYELMALFPLPFIAFMPFCLALFYIKSIKDSLAVILGSSIFIIPLAFGTHYYSDTGYVLLIFFYFLKLTLFVVPYYFLAKRFPRSLRSPFFVATLWTFVDAVFINIPYMLNVSVVLGLALNPFFLQVLSYIGQTGLTFIIIYINASLMLYIMSKKYFPQLVASLLLFSIVLIFGFYETKRFKELKEPEVSFTVIQGSITRAEYEAGQTDKAQLEKNTERYIELTNKAVAMGYKNIIWPETALWRYYENVKEQIENLTKSSNITLWGGFSVYGENQVSHNAFLSINSTGTVEATYLKNMLMPFGEPEFTKGASGQPINTPFGKIGTPICYEALSKPVIQQFITQGAELIVAITNDAGFLNTPISAFMLKQCVLRAVEYNRYFIRAAQSGYSALINSYGTIEARTELFEPTLFPVKARFLSKLTPYARFGDLFLGLLLVISLFFLYRERNKNL